MRAGGVNMRVREVNMRAPGTRAVKNPSYPYVPIHGTCLSREAARNYYPISQALGPKKWSVRGLSFSTMG